MKIGREINLKEMEMTSLGRGKAESIDPTSLKTGNRMADAIMAEKSKDEIAMASVYNSTKRHHVDASSSSGEDTPRQNRRKDSYDALSPSDVDYLTDSTASPSRAMSRKLKDQEWIRSLVTQFRDVEDKLGEESLGALEKRETLMLMSENIQFMASKLRQEAAQDVARAEQRSRVLDASLAIVSRTCQHLLDNVPDE